MPRYSLITATNNSLASGTVPGVPLIGAHSVWAGFYRQSLPATPAWCQPLSLDQTVSFALLVAEPLPEMVVPDHSDISSFPSLSGKLLDRSEPWGCRYSCGAVALCSGVWEDPSSWKFSSSPSPWLEAGPLLHPMVQAICESQVFMKYVNSPN